MSAGSPAAAVRKPRAPMRAAISCDSTWLSRQPRVAKGDGGTAQHATRSLSWPQAAPMSSPLLHRTVAVMPVLQHDAPGSPRMRGSGGRVEVRALPFVERDQVHLGAHALEQPDESPRVVRRVVDAVEQHVLEGDALTGGQREAPTGGEERLQLHAPVDRHQPVAHLVGGGVERDGEVDAEPVLAPGARCRPPAPPWTP